MKKGGIIALIIVLSILVLLLASILVMGAIHGGDFMNLSSRVEKITENMRKEQKIDINEITDLQFDFVNGDVEIFETDENELRIVQYANKELSDKEFFSSEISNKKVRIQEKDSNFWFHINFFNIYRQSFEVYIPKSYDGNIKMNNISGNILGEGEIKGKMIEMKTTSGNIKISDPIKAENITINSISGKIILENTESQRLSIETTSGEIEIAKAIGEITAKSISGSIDFENIEGKITLETTSGNIDIGNFNIMGDSQIKSISGGVKGVISQESNYEIETKSVSGNIRVPSNQKYDNNQTSYKLKIQTTSGNIKF